MQQRTSSLPNFPLITTPRPPPQQTTSTLPNSSASLNLRRTWHTHMSHGPSYTPLANSRAQNQTTNRFYHHRHSSSSSEYQLQRTPPHRVNERLPPPRALALCVCARTRGKKMGSVISISNAVLGESCLPRAFCIVRAWVRRQEFNANLICLRAYGQGGVL